MIMTIVVFEMIALSFEDVSAKGVGLSLFLNNSIKIDSC
jgi:hypothetical protein